MSVSAIKKILPASLKKMVVKRFSFVFKQISRLKTMCIRNAQHHLVNVLKDKKVINVVFLVIHDSIWKYEELYRLLDRSKYFNVQIAVIPLVRDGVSQLDTYNQTLEYFKKGNYNTFGTYDATSNVWLDVKSECNPDVVFFTNPHKLTFDKYYINNFTDKLTCYVPYAFVVIGEVRMHYGKDFHQYLWRYFLETETHNEYFKENAFLDNSNGRVTGYPGLDTKLNEDFQAKNVWKELNKLTKKIIWAPHHTIVGNGAGLDYSSFEEYHQFFIDLCKNNPFIQIAFKPHPLLREKLNSCERWGQEKTDNYFNAWNMLENGQFENGPYIDLFEGSDAMIMDSASFIAEYLYFDKPILFTLRDEDVQSRFNSFGQAIFKVLYQSRDTTQTNEFVKNQVSKEDDFLRVKRNNFLKTKILPANGKLASENIFSELKLQLCQK